MPIAPLADAPNLTEQMVAALATRIASGGIAAGAKLPSESELVAEFGVSRTVVREAISQLRARGLVATQRGIGSFARTQAAGSVEFIFCVLALRDQVCPPTLNLENPSPGCDIDLVPHRAKERPLRYALSNSFGFGGTNASVIVSRPG